MIMLILGGVVLVAHNIDIPSEGECHQKFSTLRFRPSPSGKVVMTCRNSFLGNPMYNSQLD